MANLSKELVCKDCNKTFKREAYYQKHVENKICRPQANVCIHCGSYFKRKYDLNQHVKMVHSSFDELKLAYLCGMCDKRFRNVRSLREHRDTHMGGKGQHETRRTIGDFKLMASAHRQNCEVHRLVFPEHIHFQHQAFVHALPHLEELLRLKKMQYVMFKAAFVFHVEFVKISEEAELETTIVAPFRSMTLKILPFSKVLPLILDQFVKIEMAIDEFLNSGSGWSISDILCLDVEVVKCLPITGSCGKHEVVFQRKSKNVPRGIKFTNKGFSNETLAQKDLTHEEESLLLDAANAGRCTALPAPAHENCFYLAIASHFSTEDGIVQFITHHLNTVDSNPVSLEDIAEFESRNTHLDISVNIVYQTEEKEVYPVFISRKINAKNIVLLMLQLTIPDESTSVGSDDEVMAGMHYAYVKHPSMLFAPRPVGKEGKVIATHSQGHFCFNCFNYQRTTEMYERHVKWCHQKTGQHVHMPKQGETISYKEKQFSFKNAYILVFDFESLQIKSENPCSCSPEVRANTERVAKLAAEQYEEYVLDYIMEADFAEKRVKRLKLCNHKTKIMCEQHVFSYAMIVVDRDGKVVLERSYIGNDAAEHFLMTVLNVEEELLQNLKKGGMPMQISPADQLIIDTAVDCYLCHQELGMDRVRDHDHLSGKFLGMAHNACNLHRQETFKIICFAHNFSGYDSHAIMKAVSKCRHSIKNISAIPLNTQKFKMIQINNTVMLDSLAFLPDSLEKLVDTLVASQHKFPLVKQRIWSPSNEEQGVKLLLRKGVYPYRYCSSIEVLFQTTELPAKEHFFHDIGGFDISDEDYEHAKAVWHHFKCCHMIDYTLLYNMSDTYLLAEAIVDLRDKLFDEFEVDIVNYLSLPMVTKEIALKTTGVEMELIADQEMSHMLQSNLRGGVSFVSTRYFDTNAVLPSQLHEEAPSHPKGNQPRPPVTLVFLDANNLWKYFLIIMSYVNDLNDIILLFQIWQGNADAPSTALLCLDVS